jgi:type I restriction enzyme R subunit
MTKEVTESKLTAEPEIEYHIPAGILIGPDERKKLSRIIEEINLAYNKHFNTDVAAKSALQVRDLLLKDDRLKMSAKTNTLKDFHFSYEDSVEDALLGGYEQNEEFYSLLLDNEEIKKKVMDVFIEDIYLTLKGA